MKKYTFLFTILTHIVLGQKIKIEDELLQKNKTPQSLYEIMPSLNRWLDNNRAEVFIKTSDGSMRNTILDLTSGEISPIAATQSLAGNPVSEIVFKNGDLFLKKEKNEERLTFDPYYNEENAIFSPDSQKIAYTKSNNLFCIDLSAKREIQLTADGHATLKNGHATWLYWEEIFGRTTLFRAFWWSPDSQTLAFMQFDESKTPIFPIYSAEGSHGTLQETRYPKSGDINPTAKLGFVSPNGENLRWVNFDTNTDHYLGWPKWSADGKNLIVQWINRDNNHLKIYKINASGTSKTLIFEEEQNTWISIDESEARLTLINNKDEMVILSDKSGWNQLYLYGTNGKLKNKITNGNYTVLQVLGIDEKNRMIYFQARGLESTARYDLYKVDLNGKNLKRLTFGSYHHKQIEASPDLKYFVTTYSNLQNPPQVTIIDNEGKIIKNLGGQKGENFEKIELNLPQQIRVKSKDGLFDLPMNITYPEKMETGKKYPVLISIYGGPNAGTVYDQWSWSPRSQWLSREGIIQVTMDHRASGHFGKEGQNYLYKNLGDWELEDYKTMVKYLIDNLQANPGKIAITGFSYGGYLSCLALTKHPDTFTHGMAGGAVTDWHLYDSAYTERFMDTPDSNSEGYRTGSVLTYADQLKGKLLIVHGTTDDNVHLQQSLQLIKKLQDSKKEFEMMLYPEGKHGWGGNQYYHFENLKSSFIYRHLLKKPMPDALKY